MPPPTTTTTERLADYETRYRELAAQLATIGLIHSGSVTHRYTRCQTPGCKCNAEPPQPHGPYYQWTTKNNGKTVTRRLNETEAKLYQEWIANDRQLRQLIQQMRQIAAKAAELKLKQAANP
jgi:alkanesulfonate monooxygenase SsuD/methylene tetrahydromethanopterin reductase-like flavin-dependent oxidoreductase (luciferase family)